MIECKGCEKGQEMCEHRPCWGTPNEIAYIMDQGETAFMLDYWFIEDGDRIDVISPAITTFEGSEAPFWPHGKCAFFTEDRKCAIHAKYGFDRKPIEGRQACCKRKTPANYHKSVAQMWDSIEGRRVVNQWEKMSYGE